MLSGSVRIKILPYDICRLPFESSLEVHVHKYIFLGCKSCDIYNMQDFLCSDSCIMEFIFEPSLALKGLDH